jgi:hypothetical protein
VDTPFYVKKGEAVSTLVSPVSIQTANASTTAVINVEQNPVSEYHGAVSIFTGQSDSIPAPASLAITGVPQADGVQVYIGADGETDVNVLAINGPDGLGQVYDEVYNQPVSLKTITIVESDPDTAPTGGAEIFRCGQTAVAQAGAGFQQFNQIQVPKTGAYMLQTQIAMGNGPGANTVVLPSTLVGGVPIWNALFIGMQEYSTVISVPYSSVEVIGGDFQAIDTFESNSLTIRVYSQVVFLDSTKIYAITLGANSPLWNIGSAGAIKVELIAMC